MKRKIKMLVYGEPGVGKSVFANSIPNRFFITTDGNYEWLEDFGAKKEDHKQVSSWSEFVEFINNDKNFEAYDAIVVDLLEDTFIWNEDEFTKKNKLEHIGDLGFGKGYGITRKDFFIEISKLIAKPKHIILLMHESSEVVKDRRGVESTIYRPHKSLPDVTLGNIEGRLRFVVRAYMKDVEVNGRFELERKLSVTPNPNIYGILRGINDKVLTEDIPLEWTSFINLITVNKMTQEDVKKNNEKQIKKEPEKKIVEVGKVEEIQEKKKEELSKLEDKKAEMRAKLELARKEKSQKESKEEVKETIVEEEPKVDNTQTLPKEEPKEELKEELKEEPKVEHNKLLKIKIKLRATKLGAKGAIIDKVVDYILSNEDVTDEQIIEFIDKQ